MVAEDIKKALENYHYHLELIDRISKELEGIDVKMQNVKSGPIKMPEPPSQRGDFRLVLIQKKTNLFAQMYNARIMVDLADRFIKVCPKPCDELIKDKYVKRMNETRLSQKYNYSREGIRKRINRLIELYIEST